jgi:hypothetical protein
LRMIMSYMDSSVPLARRGEVAMRRRVGFTPKTFN